jgi:rubrerythrin
MTQDLGLQEALQIAMDAEIKARDFYTQAATRTEDAAGRDLLGRLAAFEQYHYEQLAKLAKSLGKGAAFIDYETRSIEQFEPMAPGGEAVDTKLEALKDMASILGAAIENEKKAGERYRALAKETADPRGQGMFRDLANEEMMHQRILEDEFFSLSNEGTWGWSGMYGE